MRTLIYEIWEKISFWIANLHGSRGFFYFKIVIAVFFAWLLFCAILLLIKGKAFWWIGEWFGAFSSPGLAKLPKKIDKKWKKILKELAEQKQASWKLAVIEADNLLDSILKRMALPGQDMGERLASLRRGQLKSLDKVWQAHKLRNQIVHEAGLRLTKEQAEKAIKNFQSALKELGVL